MIRCNLYFLLFLVCSVNLFGQAVHKPVHLQQLDVYKTNANNFCVKNLNRFGLDQLRLYDHALDAFYNKEKSDTLNSLQAQYRKENESMQASYQVQTALKEKLLSDKAALDYSFNQMLSRSGVFLFILGAFVIFLLFTWNSRFKGQLKERSYFKARVDKAMHYAVLGEDVITSANSNTQVFSDFKTCLSQIQQRMDQFQQIQVSENGLGLWKESLMHTKKINQLIEQESNRNEALVSFAKSDSDEKVHADVNKLCIQYFDLVKDGFGQELEAVPVVATKDLEKNLPQIQVVPAAIGHLLIHVLTNAMQSVQAKASRNIKGYEPKIALSTRILPRFLQIRIHDNGDGVGDKVMDKIKKAFFTMKKDHDSGLGLYISERIMKNHHGEIKIESEKDRGTDVYLRFFLQN